MGDNRPSELQAESLITSKLLKHDFHVTKPAFDEQGADLLIVDTIDGRTTKFLKVQSKFRTLKVKQQSAVEIPLHYVTDNFILFLYVNKDDNENEMLYTFFKEDIQKWRVYNNNYALNISENSLLKLESQTFNKIIADRIKKILIAQPIKKYISMIINGIFLEKAIQETKTIYSRIWPDKEFKTPSINELIANFLHYNPFNIKCILFLSDHHSLEKILDFSGYSPFAPVLDGVNLMINKSGEIICFKVINELERIINAENVILIADDPAYEKQLNELANNGVDLVLFKMKHDSGSRMYTSMRYGDICYPIGRSLGLQPYEL